MYICMKDRDANFARDTMRGTGNYSLGFFDVGVHLFGHWFWVMVIVRVRSAAGFWQHAEGVLCHCEVNDAGRAGAGCGGAASLPINQGMINDAYCWGMDGLIVAAGRLLDTDLYDFLIMMIVVVGVCRWKEWQMQKLYNYIVKRYDTFIMNVRNNWLPSFCVWNTVVYGKIRVLLSSLYSI